MNPSYIYDVLLLHCISVINMPFYYQHVCMIIRSLTHFVASGIRLHDPLGKLCSEVRISVFLLQIHKGQTRFI
jgi:hypothetical protein